MIVKPRIERPFSERFTDDGVAHYAIYMMQALAPARIQPEAGKTYVELHWIGIALIEWDKETPVTPYPSGAELYNPEAIPPDDEGLVLVRPGLPLTALESLEWSFTLGQWKKLRPRLRDLAKVDSNQQFFCWDFGATAIDFPPPRVVTQVDAPETGEQVKIEWHAPTGVSFDLVIKARFDDEAVEASTPAKEFLENTVGREDWLQYLAKLNYIAAVESLPVSLSTTLPGVKPPLVYSARIHMGFRMNCTFMAGRSFYLLTDFLNSISEKPEVPVKLVVWAQDNSSWGELPFELRRELGIWPIPPLRPSPTPPEDILSRLENIESRLKMLRALDPAFSILGAATHRYIQNECAKESDIQKEAEDENNIRVPNELRWFWLHFSGGRVGPGEGLYTITQVCNCISRIRNHPLPQQLFNDPTFAEFEEIEYPLADAVTIAKGTEGEEFCLKISGDDIGTMWRSQPNLDFGGPALIPLQNPATGRKLGFLDWYEAWLEESIASLST